MTDTSYAYVRTEEAPTLAPPASQVGLRGWLWRNVFQSMANFSSVGAAIQSSVMIVLTVAVFWFGVSQILTLLDFAIFSAVYVDPDGVKRLACATTAQGGKLPTDHYGACYPFVSARWQFFIYGFYPDSEIWRVNIVFLIGAIGVAWLISDAMPRRRVIGVVLLVAGLAYGLLVNQIFGEPLGQRVGAQILVAIGVLYLLLPVDAPRKWAAILMLTVYPLIAFVLLTGGHLEVSQSFFIIWGAIAAALIAFGVAGGQGLAGDVGDALGGLAISIGGVLVAMLIAAGVASIDFGLVTVPTDQWGGLLVTLVVAIAGIVFSLPLGILLALGRRSSLPAVRYLSIAFIEFWRGVPLITVLFMSSVMLPFFLPEGTDFNKLMRALIGVMFFSAAYQAEVVRGGLQAIPKGQYEGAMALGLPFWKMMSLIVLPQALTLVIPGIVNTFIGLFKDTVLVLIISIFDLLGAVQNALTDASWATPTQAPTGYLITALVFWSFCFGMSRYSMFVERKLRRGRAR